MSPAANVPFPPVARKENSEQLPVNPAVVDLRGELWTEVHEEVQKALAVVELTVRERVKDVQVKVGRTKGNAFYLFTYRTFSLPDTTIDPVVVELTFTPVDQGVAIGGDVSGEQMGDLIMTLPVKIVPQSREALLGAARELAQALCDCGDQIVEGLTNTSRKAE